jgi:anti-sigma factor RsiW
MMKCTEISRQLPEYVRGRLGPEQRAVIVEHAAGCRACAEELADLQRIAQAIERHGAVLFEDHLDAEVLIAYASELEIIDSRQREDLERHLELCDPCRREYEILLHVNETLLAAEAPITSDLPVGQVESARRDGKTRLPVWLAARLGLPGQRWWHPLALAAVVLVTVGSLLTVYYLQKQPPAESHRGGRVTSVVEARSPLGPIADRPGAFVWEPVGEAKTYRVALYNSVLEKIWHSEPVATHVVELPPEVMDQMRPGQRYFWQVTAELDRGKMVKSRVFEFRLEPRSGDRSN